jgi:predicted  nucleic acid-binding Zn-ribbon protein
MERELGENQTLSEENLRMRTTLQSFTLESKDLMQNIDSLEKENSLLKQEHERQTPSTEKAIASNDSDLKKIQAEYTQLQKQYAELEEKYLELKLGG